MVFAWMRLGGWKVALLALFCGAISMPAVAARIENVPCPVSDTRLVILGDSLADGLWGSLHRVFARCANMEVVRLTQVSDGLARTDAQTWLERYRGATPADRDTSVTDIVIVQIGANDITFLRDGSSRAVFGTPEWTEAYRSRATELADGLAERATAVIWFGLPVVGSDRLEPSYQEISSLLESALVSSAAAFVDIHDITKFGTEDFAMNAEVDGRVQQVRATDQVHFTAVGYDQVLGIVASDLSRLLAIQDRSVTLQNVDLQ